MQEKLKLILKKFNIENIQSITPLGNGLINATYKVIADNDYVLQKINSNVFEDPIELFFNLNVLEFHLFDYKIDYEIVKACRTSGGNNLWETETDEVYRVLPFIQNSHTKDVVNTAEEACQAANAFGKFTYAFRDIDVDDLKEVIPNFHNLTLRYNQFLFAIKNGNTARVNECKKQIEKLLSHIDIVKKYEEIVIDKNFITRVTHHDTKISNVLFNADNKATHVIDLDTVMPGYFISDVGDMLRTYLSPVSEEEADLEKIIIRKDIYHAIYYGYTECMQYELTQAEKNNFLYAGKFMIYMQALRFCTDYLNNDIYYGAKYEKHNFVRACNQINLLEKLLEFEKAFKH